MEARPDGIWARVTRAGYTGEDGYEISVKHEMVDTLVDKLLEHEFVEMIGLGARDSLRLEAGLCLYGHDIDTSVSPIEAGLFWFKFMIAPLVIDFIEGWVFDISCFLDLLFTQIL